MIRHLNFHLVFITLNAEGLQHWAPRFRQFLHCQLLTSLLYSHISFSDQASSAFISGGEKRDNN